MASLPSVLLRNCRRFIGGPVRKYVLDMYFLNENQWFDDIFYSENQ